MDRAAFAPPAAAGNLLSSLTMKGHPEGRYAKILVTGPVIAINKLRSAFEDESLVLPTHYTYQRTADVAMQRAMDYQIKKGTIPSSQQVNDFYKEHGPSDGAAFQVYEDNIAQGASARDLVTPSLAMDGLDVDEVLGSFRHLSRACGYQHIYELGIITQEPNELDHSVGLLRSFPDVDATDTIWMIRRLQGRFLAPPLELWSALLPSPKPGQTRNAPPAMPTSPKPSTQNQNFKKRSREATTLNDLPGLSAQALPVSDVPSAVDSSPASTTTAPLAAAPTAAAMPPVAASALQPPLLAAAPTTSTTAPGKVAKSDLHVYPNPSAIGTLSNDDILSGKIHPRDIKLNLILQLALSNDNKALHNRINALYTSLGLPTRGESSITKRVSKAFEVRAKELHPRDGNGVKIPIGVLRAQFDQFRRENGARARGGDVGEYQFKGMKKALWVAAGPSRRKGKGKSVAKEEESDDQDKQEDGDEDGDEDEAALGLAEEDGIHNGIDEEEEEDMAPVKKRRRLARMDDGDYEEDGSVYDDHEQGERDL
ncbi:unnamed protein product [Zymoseptoria tritici ST99CH_3D7]|uniref:Uncharacterized protein n=1 Tax=Zymoseptoria tritici (strain ST99CH_3D7) TaxID=1276538 RepID=A0A1X7S5L1_ZYMT9|nr:unnamed protein product [Zymoseptoria tritici ST99CH_3D7]